MYVFVLIPGVEYGAASDCPQALTMTVSSSRRGCDFCQLQIIYALNSGDSGEGINLRTQESCAVAASPLRIHWLEMS